MKRGVIVRSIWAACLLIAGLNHARILFLHGLRWDYGGVNAASAAYWSSLTVLDPVVAGLLFIRPKVGIPATIGLIITNVVHNIAMTVRHVPQSELIAHAASDPFLLSQIGFMLFVAATARTAWRGS